MDLCELRHHPSIRHPWETARLHAIKRILKGKSVLKRELRVLDIGCGDGFYTLELFDELEIESITGIDINLSENQITDLSKSTKKAIFYNDYNYIYEKKYNLILLLDVIEHLEQDQEFISDISNNYLNNDGYILITAPAYKFLTSSHDTFLKHYRRYNHKELIKLINLSNLQCISFGYLFMSLFLLRLLQVCFERLVSADFFSNKGVGAWNKGKTMTKLLEIALWCDNSLLLSAEKFKVVLPGLTVWALCKKQQS